MTARRVMAGVKSYLEGVSFTLSGLTFATTQEAGDKSYPRVTIEVTGAEEDEVLLGNYTLSVEVTLETDPEKTSTADHDTACDELYAALGETPAVKTELNTVAGLQCYDVHGVGQVPGPDDGRRAVVIAMMVVARVTA